MSMTMDDIYHSLFGKVHMRNAVILPPTNNSKSNGSILKSKSDENDNDTKIGRLQINHSKTDTAMDTNEPRLSTEKKKKMKKTTLYNENGIIVAINKDLCDCMTESCPGCHFECSKCESTKCGHICRSNRNWMFRSIAVDGLRENVK